MGFPVSPIVANLYIENLKRRCSILPPPPTLWMRYVDDTFVIQKEEEKKNFLDHINNLGPSTKFTVEDNQENGFIPFLDTLVKPGADNSLFMTFYRKPTHTDQYLQWDCHHELAAKYSVVSSLTHRV